MTQPKFLSIVEQVANYLGEEIERGRWGASMPGMNRLAPELGVNAKTVEAALRILEKQGILESQGAGRRRKINLNTGARKASTLRVQFLLYEKSDQKLDYLLEMLHLLHEAGHEVSFATKTLTDLSMDAGRVARFVKANETDAWVIIGGSREVLEWFAQQGTPAFALFGRSVDVPLASTSPKKADAYAEAVDRLVALGHQRIVHLVREERRKPTPGFLEKFFLEQLEDHGIKAGLYNLPDWEESAEGLQVLLSSLFKHTPPTAMIIDGSVLFNAVRSYLGNHGILVPDQVSLICTDPEPTFTWCLPAVTHMDWDSRPLIRRVVKWVDNISKGKDDRQKTSTKAKLILGGTMGPARPRRHDWSGTE